MMRLDFEELIYSVEPNEKWVNNQVHWERDIKLLDNAHNIMTGHFNLSKSWTCNCLDTIEVEVLMKWNMFEG